MRNSAWYQKLWDKKLNEHSVTADVDAAWSDMQNLLDQQLPIDPLGGDTLGGAVAAKSAIGKVLSWLTYVLPAAAIISGAIYFMVPDHATAVKKKIAKVRHRSNPLPVETNLLIDSAVFQSRADTVTVQESNEALNLDTAGRQGTSRASQPLNRPTQTTTTTTTTTTDTQPDGKQQLTGNVLELPELERLELWSSVPLNIPKLEASQVADFKRPTTGIMRYKKTGGIKVKPEKVQKIKVKRQGTREEFKSPAYGIVAGVNVNRNSTMYFGVYGTVKVYKRITANAALQLHTPRTFIGTYTRASYFRPDSNPAITFTDSRKIAVLELPLTLSYQLTSKLKIIGGPVVSLPIKQSAVKLGVIDLPKDTLFNGNNVIGIIQNTKPNRVNYGFKVGAGVQLKSVGIDMTYQILSPYQFKNSLGTNKHAYNTLQIGITYKLGK